MAVWLVLLIPFIITIYCVYKYKRNLVWWEILIPIATSTIIILLFSWIGRSSLTKDYEYFGGYIKQVEYYEDWDEYIHQTCTRSVPCGTDSDGNTQYCDETYDCSYVDYHPCYYVAIDNNGISFNLSAEEYNKFVKQFGNESFVDMGRDYYSDDGDAYISTWNGSYESYEFVATEHRYTNKVQVSTDVFNYPNVTEEEINQYKLYDYPEIQDWNKLPAVLSNSIKISSDVQKKYDWLNGMLGKNKQVRVWVLIFDAKSSKQNGQMQEAYWKGGNKNELVICIGTDGKTVNWTHIFTWCEVQSIKIDIRNFLETSKSLDLIALSDFTYNQINTKWKRKEFADFDYLSVEIPTWSIWVIIILTIAASIGTSMFIVKNNIDTDEDYDYYDPNKNRFKNWFNVNIIKISEFIHKTIDKILNK